MTDKIYTDLFKDSSSFDEDMKIVKEIRSLSPAVSRGCCKSTEDLELFL